MTSTVLVSVAAITLALALLGAGMVVAFVYLRREFAVEKPHGSQLESLSARVAEIELQVKGLPSLWEDERKRAKRDADAARKARGVAEEKLAEVEALIEAGQELPLLNGEGGEAPGMQQVRVRLGDAPAPDKEARLQAVAHLLR